MHVRHALSHPLSMSQAGEALGAAYDSVALAGDFWPATCAEVRQRVQDSLGSTVVVHYKKRPEVSVVMNFPKESSLPLCVSFVDGLGVTHFVSLTPACQPLKLVVQMEADVVKHNMSFSKRFEVCSHLKAQEIFLDPRSSVVDLVFSYQSQSVTSGPGIRVQANPYGLKPKNTEERRLLNEAADLYWNSQLNLLFQEVANHVHAAQQKARTLRDSEEQQRLSTSRQQSPLAGCLRCCGQTDDPAGTSELVVQGPDYDGFQSPRSPAFSLYGCLPQSPKATQVSQYGLSPQSPRSPEFHEYGSPPQSPQSLGEPEFSL